MTNLGSFSIATTSVSPTIANSSITTLKLADNAVTNAKMADNAINTAELANNAVTQAKMADDSVGSAEMKTLSTLLIINSAGTTVKTLHGAGA